METRDYITVIGWVVAFLLGTISSGVIVPRLAARRKIIDWASLTESDLFARQVGEDLGLPVQLLVNGVQQASLSVVQVRLGAGGNQEVENAVLRVAFNEGSKVLRVRPVNDPGIWGERVALSHDENRCRIELAFINLGQKLDLEFLVSGYETGSVQVDGAAVGLKVRRRDPTRWVVPSSVFQGIAFNLAGIRYDPSVAVMTEIAEELKGIRSQIRSLGGSATSNQALPQVSESAQAPLEMVIQNEPGTSTPPAVTT